MGKIPAEIIHAGRLTVWWLVTCPATSALGTTDSVGIKIPEMDIFLLETVGFGGIDNRNQ